MCVYFFAPFSQMDRAIALLELSVKAIREEREDRKNRETFLCGSCRSMWETTPRNPAPSPGAWAGAETVNAPNTDIGAAMESHRLFLFLFHR